MVTPLRKKRLRTEELYTRIPEIEGKLVELEGLSRDDLLARIQIRRRDDPGYIPSECLLYFVRASRADMSGRRASTFRRSVSPRRAHCSRGSS